MRLSYLVPDPLAEKDSVERNHGIVSACDCVSARLCSLCGDSAAHLSAAAPIAGRGRWRAGLSA